MIKNKKQYTQALESLRNYENFINEEIITLEKKGAHPVEIELKTNFLNAQKEKLRLKIQEYEDLLKYDKIVVKNISDLPKSIVKARIKTGYSQSDLAKKIEIAEQQIQRYEAQDYNKANLERVVQIINALDVNVLVVLKPNSDNKVSFTDFKAININNLNKRKAVIRERKLLMPIGEKL